MTTHRLAGLDGSDPLGFLAAIGLLRVSTQRDDRARLRWVLDGGWAPVLEGDMDPVDVVMSDLEHWREAHEATSVIDRVENRVVELRAQLKDLKRLIKEAKKGKRPTEEVDELEEQKALANVRLTRERKVLDLKPAPQEMRAWLREGATNPLEAAFLAAFATGVAIDGTGQTKPTAFHFSAGQQRFLDVLLDLRESVTREDVEEALHGPWTGRVGPKGFRWRAASERLRALLAFDPSGEKAKAIPGASWLAFQALPVFPTVPVGLRAVTTCFTGRGRHERFTWPIWSPSLSLDAVRVLVGTPDLARSDGSWRRALGVAQVFQSVVIRSSQGYGNFAAATATPQ